MKKIVSIILSLLLFLVMSGCQNTKPEVNVNSEFSLTYEVHSEEPNWLEAFTIKDNGDTSITLDLLDLSQVNMNEVGNFDVTINYPESKENTITKTITIQIRDTTAPEFIGLKNITVNEGSIVNWLEGITVLDNYDPNLVLSPENVNTSQVNLNIPGDYPVFYEIMDSNNNKTTQPINVTVVEFVNDEPIITISEEYSSKIEVYSDLPDWKTFVQVMDEEDGIINISNVNVIRNNVNSNVIGSYEVAYEITDSNGSKFVKPFLIQIIDTTKPVLTLNGDSTLHLFQGDIYTELGANVTDNYDANLNPITIESNINIYVGGLYDIIYRATDLSGNTSEIKRKVHIHDDLSYFITDPKLLELIREKLNKPTGKISMNDSLNIRDIQGYQKGVTDITGLEYLKNLEYIILTENNIADITPLSNLVHLRMISFTGGTISDLSPLEKLENLREVYFHDNQISDVSVLENLPYLETIGLSNNQITELDTFLNLYNNGKIDTNSSIYITNNPIDLTVGSDNYSIAKQLNDANIRIGISNYQEEDDVSDTIDGAMLIEYVNIETNNNVPIVKRIDYSNDIDMFKFILTEETDMAIFTGYNFDTFGSLYDSLGQLIIEKDEGNGNGFKIEKRLAAGTYYIGVKSLHSTAREEYQLFVTGIPVNFVSDSPEVHFEDQQFEQLVRDTINKQIGRITEKDCATITEMLSYHRQITSISGIEKLINLKKFVILDSHISDISPLASLTQLKNLVIERSNVTDISVLNQLPQLTTLSLNNNIIHDFSPIASLTNIMSLQLDGTNLTELTQFSDLTNLLFFSFNDNSIADLTPLNQMNKLYRIYANNNQITSLSGLENMGQLEHITAYNNQLTDLSPLTHITTLRYVNLSDNQLTDASILANNPNLEIISLNSNQLTDISVFSHLTSLDELSVSDNLIQDISGLTDLTNLRLISLSGNQLTQIDTLKSLYLEGSFHESHSFVGVSQNQLDLTEGSSAFEVIQFLKNQGIFVYTE